MAPNVLFVCLHGSAKSVIAAEHFQRLTVERGLRVDVGSAGLEPDDAIPPRVAHGLLEDGIDVRSHRPHRPTAAEIAQRIERWDDVPAVSENFKRTRDVIVARVTALLDDMTGRP